MAAGLALLSCNGGPGTRSRPQPGCAPSQVEVELKRPVVDYDASWNAKDNVGTFVLKLSGGKEAKFEADDPMEFIAILSLLQGEKTVFAQPPFLTTKP
jgi:hypothetical protein